MIAALLVIVPLAVYLAANVLYIILRNHKAHQFFRLKSPQLPALSRPNIFYGHIKEVTWRDKNWRRIDDLHRKLGASFGFYMCNQPWVSTKDLDLIKLIEVDKAHRHINRSKFGLPMREFNNSIFQVDDDDWRRIRRAISPALNNHKVRSEEVTADIRHVVGQLRDSLARRSAAAAGSGLQIDVHDTFQRYTLAVIFLITYKRDNVINFDTPQDEWVQAFELGKRQVRNPLLLLSLVFPFLRSTCNFLINFHPVGMLQNKIIDYITEAADLNRTAREYHEKHQRRMSVTVENYKERSFSELKQSGKFKRRLVDTIIDAYLERKINHDDFIGSTLFLLLAGFETTAATLSCLIWHLIQNEQVQEKLRTAIREQGIDADYVQWCIMETVRWHPAVPLGTGRILGEDVTVNGITYAKGSFVMPSTYSIHHDSSIWPQAHEFQPERWAPSQQQSQQHPAAFMGFGLGPRNCVGGKLAVHEIKLVLEALLTNYKLERCPETTASYDFSAPGLIYTNLDRPIKARLVALEPPGETLHH